MKNYYEMLQVDKNATSEVINRIYKYHIKKNHPDLFDGEEKEKAKKRVQEFNEAHEVLSNEQKRKEYDEKLKSFEKEQFEEKNDNFELLRRLEEENNILQQQLLYKDRLLKEILNELNIPYATDLQESNSKINNYNSINEENNMKNNRIYKNTNKINKNIENVKVTILKIVLSIVLFTIAIIVLSYITGNDYFDFFKTLFKI